VFSSKKTIIMKSAVNTQSFGSAQMQAATAQRQEPKRLSKFALWRKENPNGIFIVKDWKAVNK
jgi:hypothetical protein